MKKGVLIIVFAVTIILLLVGAGFLIRALNEAGHSARYVGEEKALWLAEGGIQNALYEMNEGSWQDFKTSNNVNKSKSFTSSEGDYDVAASGGVAAGVVVQATGYYPAKSHARRFIKTIQIDTERETYFDWGAYGKYSLDMSGVASTDSYASDNGSYGGGNVDSNGDVGTNGSLEISGNVQVDGDAFITPEGSAAIKDDSSVTGDVMSGPYQIFPDPVVDPALEALPDSGNLTVNGVVTLNAGQYKYSSIRVNSGELILNGDVDIYITGGVKVTSQITLNGSAEIYIDGNASIGGNGIVNISQSPEDLLIYGTGGDGQRIKYSGTSDLYSAVYAPNSDISFNGTSALYGAVIGGDLSFGGTYDLHYDESLSDLPFPNARYKINNWREII